LEAGADGALDLLHVGVPIDGLIGSGRDIADVADGDGPAGAVVIGDGAGDGVVAVHHQQDIVSGLSPKAGHESEKKQERDHGRICIRWYPRPEAHGKRQQPGAFATILSTHAKGRLMDFDQLHTFLEIVRLKSFSKAALTCYRTQPAISAQVRQLEQELRATCSSASGAAFR